VPPNSVYEVNPFSLAGFAFETELDCATAVLTKAVSERTSDKKSVERFIICVFLQSSLGVEQAPHWRKLYKHAVTTTCG
jgi:hypothetical protein